MDADINEFHEWDLSKKMCERDDMDGKPDGGSMKVARLPSRVRDAKDTEFVHEPEELELDHFGGNYDMIISSMSLHWVNDLPGMLNHAKKNLKEDGVFLAVRWRRALTQIFHVSLTQNYIFPSVP